jgi:uncharacterized protein (UPF0264 family)
MENIERMYYGFGRILLALSMADGKVDRSEIESLEKSVQEAADDNQLDLSMVQTAFKQWKGTPSFSAEEMLSGGIKDFHLGDLHLTPKIARIFRDMVIDLVHAESPVTPEEQEMARSFISYLHEREARAK